MGGGCCLGLVTESWTGWNNGDLYNNKKQLFGLTENKSSNAHLQVTATNANDRAFGSGAVVRFEADMDAKTLAIWRDGASVGVIAGLPVGAEKLYVVSSMHFKDTETTITPL